MSIESIPTFIDAVRQLGLLSESQLAELQRLGFAAGDALALARDLVQRGWITSYQVPYLLRGRGAELVLGSYVLLELIGEGGMGQVFKARHTRMGRDVALKVIRKQKLTSTEAVKRFQREIQAAAQLHHPNIVLAYDADHVNDTHFFAMEFVDGVTLGRLVKERGPLPVAEACDYIRQAALGLQHAFERGMVHRDIKPANLLLQKPRLDPRSKTTEAIDLGAAPATGPGASGLRRSGAGHGVIKLLDLGLARVDDAAFGMVQSALTQEGLVLGTPDFLAPEQAKNASKVDIRADLYGLGCTLYYLLTAQVPFPGGTPTEKVLKHYMDHPTPVTHLRPDVPPGVAAIVQRLMAKRPEDRFQTPAELVAALTPYCGLPGMETAAAVAAVIPMPVPGMTPTIPLAEPTTDSRFRVVLPTREKLEASHGTRRGREAMLSWLAVAAGVLVLLAAVGLIVVLPAASKSSPPPDTVTNSLDMLLVLVKPGTFRMGSPPNEDGRQEAEGPDREVTLTQPFYLAAHEVTQAQYQAVMGRNPAQFSKSEAGSLPVESVTWKEAVAFCKALSERAPEKQAGRVYRLPTEAEWEYACRAGTTSKYSTGDTLSAGQAAFNAGQKRDRPATVGSFPANPWGLFDLHGNVWEWCADYYDERYYTRGKPTDPTGPVAGYRRSVRGGAWDSPANRCRSAARYGHPETHRAPDVGFRVAMSVPE